MSDEVNTTQGLSPRDFSMTLGVLTDAELNDYTDTQFWCWKNLQNQEIDYKSRYHACKLEQFVRSKRTHKHDNI